MIMSIMVGTGLLIQANTAYAVDAIEMLINLSNSLGAMMRLVAGAAYVIGFGFFFKALYHLKIYGELRTMMASQTSLKQPLTYMAIGVIFIYLPSALDLAMTSTYGEARMLGPDEWEGGTFSSAAGMNAIFLLVRFIGLVAFVRGWMLISKSAQAGTPGNFGKGMTHIIGGVLGMNIVATANIMSATLGIRFGV